MDIVVFYVFEARSEWTEVLLVLFLSGGGDGGQGASMKGADSGDDDWRRDLQFRMSVFASQFDSCLVRFRAGVTEKSLIQKIRGRISFICSEIRCGYTCLVGTRIADKPFG